MTDGWIIDDFTMIQKEAEKAKKEEAEKARKEEGTQNEM